MCYTRVIYCRHRGCYNTVGSLILEPCEHAAAEVDRTTCAVTPIQQFRQLDDTRPEEIESERGAGGDEWLAVSRAHLFGCGYRDFVERHRCGYQICADCFQRGMMESILELVEKETGVYDGTQSLLARRQHLSLTRQARMPRYGGPTEEYETPMEMKTPHPSWPVYPATPDGDVAMEEGQGRDTSTAQLDTSTDPMDYPEDLRASNTIRDSPFIDDAQFEAISTHLQQEQRYSNRDQDDLCPKQEPGVQDVGFASTTMLAIDPQLLNWQDNEGQLIELFMQSENVGSQEAPSWDTSSCVEDVGDSASMDILGWDANVETAEGEQEQDFTRMLEEPLFDGDVGGYIWNQDLTWETNGYYS